MTRVRQLHSRRDQKCSLVNQHPSSFLFSLLSLPCSSLQRRTCRELARPNENSCCAVEKGGSCSRHVVNEFVVASRFFSTARAFTIRAGPVIRETSAPRPFSLSRPLQPRFILFSRTREFVSQLLLYSGDRPTF